MTAAVSPAPDAAVIAPTPTLPADVIPLLVGIAGHHELELADEPVLRESVRGVLDEIALAAPHTPLAALSTLAPGAGLLGAEAALEAGIAVIACIPAPRAAFEAAYRPEELARYRAVLARVAHVIDVAHEPGDVAGRQAAGWYLAFHSHVLIALWDGGPPRSSGGTGDVVRLRETGLLTSLSVPEPMMQNGPDPMPVFAVAARRRGAPPLAGSGTVTRRYPRRFSGDTQAQKTFDASIERLDRFNEDLADNPRIAADGAGLAGLMARTDRAANRLQRRALHQLQALYALSLVAVAAQLGFADRLGPEPVKIATLAAAFIAYRVARSANLENRYQDYRAVAEGLRVQIAWNALGGRTRYVDPYYLRMQQSELQWIRMALRSAQLLETLAPASTDERAALDWVRQQWRYYHRAAVRDEKSSSRFHRVGKTSQYLGLFTMAFAAVLLLPPLHALPLWLTLGSKHFATSLTALVGAAAALFGSYADKRGYSANAKRYDRMFAVFDRALRQAYRVAHGTAADRALIYYDVGREALVEQAEWLLARRDRPLRVVGR